MIGQAGNRKSLIGLLEGFRGRILVSFFGLLITITDFLPPKVRYGYGHRATRAVFKRQVPAVLSPYRVREGTKLHAKRVKPSTTDMTCVLATDHLETGGIGSVVEVLAGGLPSWGVRPIVLCREAGVRAQRLRDSGIEVLIVGDTQSTSSALKQVRPDVIQLHSAPSYVERIALSARIPLVTVMHNTEIHFTRARWERFRGLMERSAFGIAVSETVRAFHARHLSTDLATRLVVVPNDAPPIPRISIEERERARRALELAVGQPLDGAIVFTILARYDSQKNIAGTVASFLRAAAEIDLNLHLVVAGEISDWIEFLRADSIAGAHVMGRRVHLLQNSSAATLLSASDAFLLNSFFEGWPVAATEASAIGLPLLLSDAGGARELVARDPHRSVVIPNACGDADSVCDARVRRARRKSLHQSNQDAFAAAMKSITENIVRNSPSVGVGSAVQNADTIDMVKGHAGLIRAAAKQGV